jgi:hypothetical protein
MYTKFQLLNNYRRFELAFPLQLQNKYNRRFTRYPTSSYDPSLLLVLIIVTDCVSCDVRAEAKERIFPIDSAYMAGASGG